jgi:ATP-dependent DNA helicase RecG
MSGEKQYSLPLEPPHERPVQLLAAHEAFARADSALIGRLIEDSVVEKKNGRIKPSPLSEYFSMWANTGPHGGLIVVGIENDGTKSGLLSLSSTQLAEIEQTGSTLCPDARYETKRINIINAKGHDDFVLLIYVRFSAKRVIENHRKEAFIRRGDQKHKLSDFEKHNLRLDRGEIDFEDEGCGLSYPSDFDMQAIEQFASGFLSKMPNPLRRTPEEVLQMRHLGKIAANGKFMPNNACALLFAIDPCAKFPGCKLRVMRFGGDSEGSGAKYHLVHSRWIEGQIPFIINTAREAVRPHIKEFIRMGAAGKFVATPEYPEDAWHEAIVNACVHRSYNIRNSHIEVKIFDSRMVIESPGGFPEGITPENIYNHSVPRNRRLAEALMVMDYVQCAHEGTRRMRDTMQELGLPPPRFSQAERDGLSVQVVLENNVAFSKQYVDERAVAIIGYDRFSGLNEKERILINFTAEHGKTTVSDTSRVVRGGWKQAKNLLESLCRAGIMTRVSPMEIDRDPKAHFVLRKSDEK